MNDTKRKKLDLTATPLDEQALEAVREGAASAGFTREQHQAGDVNSKVTKTGKIDGRSRRRTGRTVQFNMRVTPETHNLFYAAMDRHGFDVGEELLIHLLKRGRDEIEQKPS